MRALNFPYIEYRGRKAPIIPISLKARDRWNQAIAYVDSGATTSIFKAEEAERLGINFKSRKKGYATVGDGSSIPVYFHNLRIKIGDEEFEATIAFSSRLGVGFNLLGRRDIFTRFDITFSDSKEIVTFASTKSF